LTPISWWLYYVGKQSIDQREVGHLDGEALAEMITAANSEHDDALAAAIAYLSGEYA
jgi:hypothetical protein